MNPEYDYLFKLLVRARDDAMRATARDACVRFRVGSFHAFIGHARVPLRSCTGNARARARACDADIDRERGRRWKTRDGFVRAKRARVCPREANAKGSSRGSDWSEGKTETRERAMIRRSFARVMRVKRVTDGTFD